MHIPIVLFLLATSSICLGGCGSAATGPADQGASATLKLEDYLSWCSVGVNGGATSTTPLQTLSFPVGTLVHLNGDPASSTFVLGYWVGTAGGTRPSHDTNKSTTVTMNQNIVVPACCPLATAPGTPCPAPTP